MAASTSSSPSSSPVAQVDTSVQEELVIPSFLLPTQQKHFATCYQILMERIGCLDTSEQGTGKTYTTIALAQTLNMPIFVVCPGQLVSKWSELAKKHGVTVTFACSYGDLTSTYSPRSSNLDRVLKHGYLRRVDKVTPGSDTGKGKHKVNFYPEQKLLDAIASSTLFIFDEAHFMKNDSQRFKAVRVITRAIVEADDGISSRYILLTGTPCDKKEQAIRYSKLMGYITLSKLYTIRGTDLELLGMQEMINCCKEIDYEKTMTIATEEKRRSYHGFKDLVYELLSNIIIPVVSSAMPPLTVKVEGRNAIYKVNAKDASEFDELISQLEQLVLNKDGTARKPLVQDMGKIVSLLAMVEAMKCPVFVSAALDALQSHPGSKVIVCLNYINGKGNTKSNVDRVYEPLKELGYHPLALLGCMDMKLRDTIIKAFQNEPKHRVMVLSTELGIGIDLHDMSKDGHAPRHVFMSPSHKLISMEQAGHRAIRSGVNGITHLTTIFLDGKRSDADIMKALTQKKENIKGMLTRENREKRVFVPDLRIENYETR